MACYGLISLFCAVFAPLSSTHQVSVLQKLAPADLLEHYVSNGEPVLLQNHVAGLETRWPSLEELTKLPDTYTSFVEPSAGGGEISLWEFLSRYDDENLRVETDVPQSYR